MRWLSDEYQEWEVSKIKLPRDIAQRMKQPHVIALAESMDELGGKPMHAPSINADASPAELVAGRDRMAATLLRKRKKVWVHVGVDWTPLDLLKAEIHENLHRRHDDKSSLTKALVDRALGLVVSGRTSRNSDEPLPTGRPKTDRAMAREIVADATGDSVDLVKKHDQIATAREVPPVAAPTRPAALLLETNGKPLPERVAGAAKPVIEVFKRIDGQLVKAQAMLSDLGITDFSPVVQQQLKALLHETAARFRHEMPTHLCPKCSGNSVPVAGPFCGLCQERGAVTRAQYEAAPRKGGVSNEEYSAGLDPVAALEPEDVEFGTPKYHRLLAARHAASGGACGCKSCGFVEREAGAAAEVDMQDAPIVVPKKPNKKAARVDMNDGRGPREVDEVMAALEATDSDEGLAF